MAMQKCTSPGYCPITLNTVKLQHIHVLHATELDIFIANVTYRLRLSLHKSGRIFFFLPITDKVRSRRAILHQTMSKLSHTSHVHLMEKRKGSLVWKPNKENCGSWANVYQTHITSHLNSDFALFYLDVYARISFTSIMLININNNKNLFSWPWYSLVHFYTSMTMHFFSTSYSLFL